MNPGYYFIFALIGFVLLIFWIIPKFYKRKIEAIFIQPKSDIFYVLTNAKSSTMTKRGIIENHRIFFNKANLKTGEIIFSVKVNSFSTGMLNGYASVVGINEKFSFIIMSGNRLFVIKNDNGQIILTHKSLVKKFPELKGFKANEIKYDHHLKTLIIYDLSGYGYALNPEVNEIQKFSGKLKEEPDENDYRKLDTYHFTKLNFNERNRTEFDHPFFSFNKEKRFRFVENQGSKRKYVVYDTHDNPVTNMKDDFLNPKILTSIFDENKFCFDENFLVLHYNKETNHVEDALISCVSPSSESIWKRPVTELFPGLKTNEYSLITYMPIGNKTNFMCFAEHTSSNKIYFREVVLENKTLGKFVEMKF